MFCTFTAAISISFSSFGAIRYFFGFGRCLYMLHAIGKAVNARSKVFMSGSRTRQEDYEEMFRRAFLTILSSANGMIRRGNVAGEALPRCDEAKYSPHLLPESARRILHPFFPQRESGSVPARTPFKSIAYTLISDPYSTLLAPNFRAAAPSLWFRSSPPDMSRPLQRLLFKRVR